MLLFFGMLYAGLSARPAPVGTGCSTSTSTAAWSSSRRARHWSDVAGGGANQQYRLRDLVAALDAAEGRGRVKAVALDLDGFTGGGQTAIGDLADAVRRVRGAGKPVIAYAPAIPTTAISSPPRRRKSGSIRWARC